MRLVHCVLYNYIFQNERYWNINNNKIIKDYIIKGLLINFN